MQSKSINKIAISKAIKERFYGEVNNMSLIRISESEDFIIDYDKERGMYRVSVFNDGHFQDEYWFEGYEKRTILKEKLK